MSSSSVLKISRGALFFALIATLIQSPAHAEWKPTQPITFLVMAGEGGGADKIARLVAKLINDKKYASTRISVRNLSGNSGADALKYMQANADNDHLLLFTLNSYFTVPITQPKLGIDVLKFRPIARLGLDPFLLWVNTDRNDIKSIRDFIGAAHEKNWTMAGTGTHSEDELLTSFLNFYYKLAMEYQPHSGGGKVARLLSEHRVNSTVNNPGEMHRYLVAGKTKPIAAFTQKRLPQFANVPTFWELGLKFEYLMQRGVAGPPAMSEKAARYYTGIFRKVFDDPNWQNYRKRVGLVGEFKSGEQLRTYWSYQIQLHKRMIELVQTISEGWLKK